MSRGIRTIEDLRERCWIDTDTDCWHWRGATSLGSPAVCIPGHGGAGRMGRAVCFLKTGKLPARGVIWHCVCATRHCANPEHLKPTTRSAVMRKAIIKRGPAFVAKAQAVKRARSTICNDEIAAAIRASDESLPVLAARYAPMSAGMVWRIRKGQCWLPTVRGASVLSFMPADRKAA